ncbi:MAG: uroporphyrinogen-III synthase [Candidatus Eremiobacteraeota bacterium]|nr:uroporphyrinogen-III synthase [Candidatus Eremiobacteraeota bacterium]MCW5867724.1 uroporphyrinogen-III synthase [Candidatus Eremiobacteraeota bacterium]
MTERWRWCQAIEAAGGLLPGNWVWLSQAPAQFPADSALILEPSCGSPAELAARLPGRTLRLLTDPLTPRQRCRPFPCAYEGPWVLLAGEAAGPNTWEARPLYGQRIALTREPSQAKALQQRLEELGAEVVLCPVLRFIEPDDPGPLQQALAELESFDWVLFTSPNGVRTFFEALPGDARRLGRARLAVIGPGTAQALAGQGLKADLVPARSVAEGLLEALAEEPMEGRRVLIPRAQEAREVLPEGLRSRGAQVVVAACYKTIMPDPPPRLEAVDRVVLMSSSAARHFRQLCQGDPECVCIGPVTAQTARELGFARIVQAEQFDLEGVVKVLLSVQPLQ